MLYRFIIYLCYDKIFCKYLLQFEISDYITSTTCTIFDDEAKKMLNITVLNLLESFKGNTQDVPKSILQLYGKVYIFQFKMNNQNLTEGR
jgi:hypothetical protein